MYSVKEVSEIMNISPYTLRFYDNAGLFPELMRKGNRRYFSQREIGLVNIIQCLRSTGMPLAEIRRYIDAVYEGTSSIPERRDMVVKQRDKVKEDIKELKLRLKTLENKVKYYDSVLSGKDPSRYVYDVKAVITDAKLGISCGRPRKRAKPVKHKSN